MVIQLKLACIFVNGAAAALTTAHITSLEATQTLKCFLVSERSLKECSRRSPKSGSDISMKILCSRLGWSRAAGTSISVPTLVRSTKILPEPRCSNRNLADMNGWSHANCLKSAREIFRFHCSYQDSNVSSIESFLGRSVCLFVE